MKLISVKPNLLTSKINWPFWSNAKFRNTNINTEEFRVIFDTKYFPKEIQDNMFGIFISQNKEKIFDDIIEFLSNES